MEKRFELLLEMNHLLRAREKGRDLLREIRDTLDRDSAGAELGVRRKRIAQKPRRGVARTSARED